MEKAFRIFTVITVSVMTLFFVSCEADETLSSEKMNDECIIDNSLNDLKIPKEAVALTLKDAENVALMYLKKQSETKSFFFDP